FFAPRRFRDTFGNDTQVRYDAYDLFAIESEDALHNKVTAGERDAADNIQSRIDYRLLQPALLTDPNGNRTEAAFDILGMATGTAVMGKAGEGLGDTLQGFSTDLDLAQIDAFFADPIGQGAALLGNATSRFIYDVERYFRFHDATRPAAVGSIVREQHVSDL